MAVIVAAAGGGNWSAGGSWVGGIAPTAADDAQLNATSGAITIDGTSGTPNLCRSLDCTGYTGTLTQGSGATLNIGDAGGGSLTLVAGMTYAPNAASKINFVSTTTGNTITTAAKQMGALGWNGAGGGWTFQDGYSNQNGSAWTLTQGTLDTNGKTFTITSFTDSGTAARTLTLGASSITLGNGLNWTFTSATGLTFNCGTSTINMTGGVSGNLSGAGQTFNNVTTQGTGTVSGNNTFNSFTAVGTTFSGSNTFTTLAVNTSVILGANQTVGTLSSTATATARGSVVSSVIGTQRTITATNVTAQHLLWRDILGAGSFGWNLSAADSGDAGGNSGITFTTGTNQFFQSAVSTSWNTAGKWFLATNGGGGAGRVPLPQDTAIFDANSITAASVTITVNIGSLPAINFTGMANTPAFAFTTAARLYGDVTFIAGMTVSGTTNLTFSKRGSQSFTSAGLTITNPLVSDSFNGTATLADALTTSNTITETTGNITTASTVSCTTLTISAGTFTLGGNVTLTGALSVTGTLTGAFNVTGGTTVTGAGTINIATFSGTTATQSNGSAWTFTTLTLSGAFTNSAVSGNLTIGSGGMTCTTFAFGGTGGSGTFTSGSGLINCSSTATWGGNGTCVISLGSGGFTCTTLTLGAGASVPTYNLGSGTITLTGTGTVFTAAGTINRQTSTILISNTSVSTKTFSGSTANYNNIRVNGAASNGTVTFSGAFTCSGTMTFDPDANIIFTKTTTYTIGTIAWTGTSGHPITIATNTAASPATISCANLVSCDYLSLKDNTASGNVPFYAGANSTNVSGNTNWNFTVPPGFTGTLAATQAADTMAASGLQTYTGVFAATQAADTMAASGAIASSSITGSMSMLQAADTMVAAGNVPIKTGIQSSPGAGMFRVIPRKKEPKELPDDWFINDTRRQSDLKKKIRDTVDPPKPIKMVDKPIIKIEEKIEEPEDDNIELLLLFGD